MSLNASVPEQPGAILRKEGVHSTDFAGIDARRRQISRSWASRMRSGALIALKRGGPRKLFLVHDGEGETMLYLSLARRLPDDLAVFGIEPRRIARVPLAHARIEDMAASYIQAVRKIQPHGPYRLGGLCAGGVIAYEMASQLVHAGESLELVALLDAAAPNGRERSIARRRINRLRQALVEAQRSKRAISKRAKVVVNTILQKAANLLLWEFSQYGTQWSVRARFRLLRAVLRYGLAWPGFVPELSVRQIYDCARARHVPKPLSISSIVLVRARTGDASVADDTPFQEIYDDETFGWNAVAYNLTVVDVDGGHSTMLHERFVHSLASVLLPYLQQEAQPVCATSFDASIT
jgi:thioesterase domain-containing protein